MSFSRFPLPSGRKVRRPYGRQEYHVAIDKAVEDIQVELDSKVNITDYEDSDVLLKIKNVDGATSGLDADLLDGQQGTYYLSRANHTGTQTASTISDFSTATDARITAAIGSTVQAFDSDLTALAALSTTAYGRGFNTLADASALRTYGGLVIGTNVQAFSSNLTTWSGIAPATGIGTFLATPTSANLLAAMTTKTGTGNNVFSTSPTLQDGFFVTGTLPQLQLIPSGWGGSFGFVRAGINNGLDGPGDNFVYYAPLGKTHLWSIASVAVMRIDSTTVKFPTIGTTAAAANGYIDNAAGNSLLRSTSSRRYKEDITDVTVEEAKNILRKLRGIRYRSKAPADDNKLWFYGLIAEDVAEVDPRLVQWSFAEDQKTLRPESVMYDRLGVLLLIVQKDLDDRLTVLEEVIRKEHGNSGKTKSSS